MHQTTASPYQTTYFASKLFRVTSCQLPKRKKWMVPRCRTVKVQTTPKILFPSRPFRWKTYIVWHQEPVVLSRLYFSGYIDQKRSQIWHHHADLRLYTVSLDAMSQCQCLYGLVQEYWSPKSTVLKSWSWNDPHWYNHLWTTPYFNHLQSTFWGALF